MGRGRPPKSKAQKALEGDKNKGKGQAVSDMPLAGLPICPDTIDAVAAAHFTRVADELATLKVVKRIDSEALSVLGETWSDFWRAAERMRAAEDAGDLDLMREARMLKYQAYAAWSKLASKFCLTPADRLRMVAAGESPKLDAIEERFFKTVG